MSVFGAALLVMAVQADSTVPRVVRLPAKQPTAEELDLGRSIARKSTAVLNMQIDFIVATAQIATDNPQLTGPERTRLREIGRREGEALRARLIEAEGYAYAVHLSVETLRAIADFESSPAGSARRNAMPAINETISSRVGELGYNKVIRTAFCAETGKLCP